MRREISIVLLVAAGFVLLRSVPRQPLRAPGLPPLTARSQEERRRAVPFTLSTPGGELQTLDQYEGRVVLLNFWATWCPPCVEELPSLEALYRELRDDGLVVLAVSVDAGRAGAVEGFVERRGLSFPVLHDPQESVARRYGVRVYPTSFILDERGRIVHAVLSAWDWSDPAVLGWFRELLGQGAGTS